MKRAIVTAFLFLTGLRTAYGFQDGSTAPPAFKVRGAVREAGTAQPIQDVEVSIRSQQSREVTHTGADGVFVFTPQSPGGFEISAKKPGYDYTGPLINVRSQLRAVLTIENPEAVVNITLARPSAIQGRIIDAESKKPLGQIQVIALAAYYRHGHRVLAPTEASAITNDDGNFALSGIRPGEYFLQTEQARKVSKAVRVNFTKTDLERQTTGYFRSYWPEESTPMTIYSGAIVNLGDLQISQGNAYHLYGSLHASGCDGEKIGVYLYQSHDNIYEIRAQGAVPCDGEFLIDGLAPGAYQVAASSLGKPAGEQQFGGAHISVFNRDVELPLDLHRGMRVEGKIAIAGRSAEAGVAAPNSALPPVNLVVRPASGGINFGAVQPQVSSDGRFELKDLRGGEIELRLQGLAPNLCVSAVRYNGHAVSLQQIPLDSHAPAHSIEIDLSDKPARIQGRVMESDKGVLGARVVLVTWPQAGEALYASARIAESGKDGSFAFVGLSPGEYRLIAVPGDLSEALEAPGALEAQAAKADAITLENGAQQTLWVGLSRLK